MTGKLITLEGGEGAGKSTVLETVRELLAAQSIRHLTTRPYRPQTNGKVERFHQTMGREWAHGRRYPTSDHRAQRLPDWLEHYNHRRPHSALDNRPPISRVHNL